MDAGKLDRRATIQSPNDVSEPDYGSEQLSWETVATVWATVRDGVGSERITENVRVLTRRTEITIRWRDGITSDMRVVLDDGRTFQIVSIAEVRRVSLTMLCEQYDG